MDALRQVVANPANPAGTVLNLLAIFYALQAVPPLPTAVSWLQTNFFARVLLIGLLLWRNNMFGGNMTTCFMVAAATIVVLNVLNKQPALGDMSFGSFKLPGM